MPTKPLCLLMLGALSLAPQPQPFRARVTLVPVDVRVLDSSGKPITDLKKTDFTILEDGQKQEIDHFEAGALVAVAPEPGAKPAMRTAATADAPLTTQKQRTFLLVLGRGRLQDPVSHAIDSAIHFVRERLLPQDQIAVLAYNRATAFTTDHETTAVLLERYKKAHEGIESKLKSRLSGLAAVYGAKTIPASLQRDIDQIFRGSDVRALGPAGAREVARVGDEARRNAADVQRAEIVADRPPEAGGADYTFDLAAADRIDLPFDDYVEKNAQTMQDVGNVYTGIEYLRYIDGEKHLVFITDSGMFLPRLEDDKSVAARANDARVTLDVIHTAGFPAPPAPPSLLNPRAPATLNPLPTTTTFFNQTFQAQTSRLIAEVTGGQASVMTSGDKAFARLDQATRFEYLLGYYPSNAAADGRYRRITVKVNRGGATVLYRHGYYARQQPAPFDRQQFLTYSRIVSAGTYQGDVTDLKVRLKASKGERGELLVDVTIEPSRVSFADQAGLHVGSLDVAFFAGDDRQNVIGEAWHKIDLKLRDEVYQRFQREGASYTARIGARGDARYVKVIVYDYAADLVGSAVAKVQ